MTFDDLGKDLNDMFDEILTKDVRKTTIDLHRDLVQKSPVDTGAFRGDWEQEIFGKEATISNDKEYARRLAEGSSKQAPNGWVDNAIDKAVRLNK